jgi:ribosomal-protein-serine acetyltransferase
MTFEIHVNEKIVLKLRNEDDVEKMFELVDNNREHLQPWFPWVDTTLTTDDSREFILKCHEKFIGKKALDLGVWYDGVLVGSMGFHTIKQEHDWAEIGYWVAKEYEGKGIITACTKAIIEYGFNELNLHRIQIRCDSLNLKSKAIPERLGFTYEGTTREDHKRNGMYSNGLIYGLLRNEWNG